MNSMERVLTALAHKQPDRVPLMLLFSLYGAKELGISIKEYFSNPENVIEAQLKMHKKYRTDCLYAFFYASLETEAFGGKTIFVEDGPPNSADLVIANHQQIAELACPELANCAGLQRVLTAISGLKKEVQDTVPIIGVVMSPFSLPVMQLGFESYFDLIMTDRPSFDKLMNINKQFCIAWANAQIDAGATAICYFDPVSSPTIVQPALYRETGMLIARDTIGKIKGPTATHFASGRCKSIVDDVASTGTAIIGISSLENPRELKELANKRLSLLGNLNGIEMCRWTKTEAEEAIRVLLDQAGQDGGLLIAENHGEIPYYVSENTLLAISDAAEKWSTCR